MTALISGAAGPLSGKAAPPGDKSISHRALILGALAVGETRVTGILESADVLATAAALRAMGARIEKRPDGGGAWRVFGRGVGGLAEPASVLDMGNSGTACRLLMGVVAGHPITATFTGDESLSTRPMERVMAPLRQMGARFTARSGGRLPITVTGAEAPIPIEYTLPVASAQVKSAVLLAGLGAPGETTVVEPEPTRDHTERMLGHFGADVRIDDGAPGGRRITVTGQPELAGAAVHVPADVSSAAFPLVAALLVPGSDVRLAGVGVNPLRAGLLETLAEMGAEVTHERDRDQGGEPVCDIVARASRLAAVDVPAARAPSMIDEYPILAVAAALADGTTRMAGLGELRVKESDRLAAIAVGLRAAGIACEETEDTLAVTGTGGKPPKGGAVVKVGHDHRIAMAFLTLGMVSERPIEIDDAETIDTSFPGFRALMNGLGADIREKDA